MKNSKLSTILISLAVILSFALISISCAAQEIKAAPSKVAAQASAQSGSAQGDLP